jgi:hypothetical protein
MEDIGTTRPEVAVLGLEPAIHDAHSLRNTVKTTRSYLTRVSACLRGFACRAALISSRLHLVKTGSSAASPTLGGGYHALHFVKDLTDVGPLGIPKRHGAGAASSSSTMSFFEWCFE